MLKIVQPQELKKTRDEGRVKYRHFAKLVATLLKKQMQKKQFTVSQDQDGSHIKFHFTGIDNSGARKSCGITLVIVHKRKRDKTLTGNEVNDFMNNITALCNTFATQS